VLFAQVVWAAVVGPWTLVNALLAWRRWRKEPSSPNLPLCFAACAATGLVGGWFYIPLLYDAPTFCSHGKPEGWVGARC
jgi:hypothetical protein